MPSRRFARAVAAALLAAGCGHGTFVHADADSQWELAWSDEFDGTGAPDPTKWILEEGGGGWGNHELQSYTKRAKNVRQEGGRLVIEAHREDFAEEAFTSGRLRSRADWTFGRFEIRARMPKGVGTWAALWLYPTDDSHGWPDSGEIDIAEYVGRDPDGIISCFYSTEHSWVFDTGRIAPIPVERADQEFHVYSADWTDEEITTSVDGKVFHRFQNPHSWKHWPFLHPFHVIMNLAIGGFGGEADEAAFPARLEVDYVRIYRLRRHGLPMCRGRECRRS
ncbi:MAG: glycoside hydrolase family 16 protein [Elusimicrobia bacterium]|nr:glycoside hydrolase family 16 protein [Elusimicrobiota bacterium]